MSRFHFIVGCSGYAVESDEYSGPDGDGAELAGPDHARRYANCIIEQLKQVGRYDDPGLAMFVKDADGEVLFAIPLMGSVH